MYRFSNIVLSFILFLVMLPLSTYAFDGGLFKLHGVVVEATTGEPIPGVAVVCQRTKEGVISNVQGQFVISISWSDSLIFSALTYDNITVKPAEAFFREGLVFKVKLAPTQHLLDEFSVQGEERVAIPLRSDVFKEKPKVTDYFFRPISVLYYYASKREKRKRYLIRMIEQEKLLANYEHVYNRESIAKCSGLEDRELDYCMIYCNANLELHSGDSEEVVKWRMMTLISEYYKLKAAKEAQ